MYILAYSIQYVICLEYAQCGTNGFMGRRKGPDIVKAVSDPSVSEENVLKMAVAKLRTTAGTQVGIAEALGVSQSRVSRLLASNEWVAQRWEFNGDSLAPEVWALAKQRYFDGKPVRDALEDPSGRLLQVHIVDLRDGKMTDEVAKLIIAAILRARFVGITWGRTMAALADLIRRNMHDRTAEERITFVPLCGEALNERATFESSSSAVAGSLDVSLNGPLVGAEARKEGRTSSLAGLPAFIPMRYDEQATATIQNFLRESRGYQDIFGDVSTPGGLISKLDAIITSIGPATVPKSSDRGAFLRERISARDISEEEVVELLAGDLGGILVHRQGKSGLAKVEGLNRRWMGARLEHYEQCAERAKEQRLPGVVVVAFGIHRREVVTQCVRLGLINQLIVDRSLARSISSNVR